MPLNQVDQLTALEVTRRANAKDAFHIIEALSRENELLIDMPAIQANDGTVHNTVIRTSLRAGSKRVYNQGVTPGASTTKTILDRICTLEDYSVTDKMLADDSGDKEGLFRSEDIAFLTGFGISMSDDLIYGDPEQDQSECHGLATRLNALADTENVFSAAGTGSALTSLYVCALGEEFAHLIYPKGHKSVGVEREDRGYQDWKLADGTIMPAYVRHFSARYGISVRHPKAIKRICNINPASVDPAVLVGLVLKAIRYLPGGASNVAIYGNKDAMCILDQAAYNKVNAVYTKDDPWGNAITHIRQARCRTVEAILSTESAIA